MKSKLNQRGAISLISVVIFATIITVLITAYLKSAITQQTEAISYDASTRAYYAAVSGVQDTINVLKGDSSKQITKSGCNPFNSDTNGYTSLSNYADSGYTCQRLNFRPVGITGKVQQNKQAVLVKLNPSDQVLNSDILNLVTRWSKDTPSQACSPPALYPRSFDAPYLSASNQWRNGSGGCRSTFWFHTMLRLEVIIVPKTGVTTNNTTQKVTFLNPTQASTPGATSTVNFTPAESTDYKKQQEQLFVNAQCYDSNNVPANQGLSDGESTYSCKKSIDLTGYSLNDTDIYVRVSGVYRSGFQTDFSLQLVKNGNPIALSNDQVAVDITGRAGDNTYRRVVQRIPLSGYKVQTGPDAAIIAGEGICKNFALGTSSNVYQEGCNPLAP